MTHRGWLLLLLAVSLILRLTWGMQQPVDEQSLASLPDQREYLELGRNLLHGDGLHFYDPRFGDNVWASRTPGYPVLIAMCGGNLRAIRMAQAAIDTSSVLAAYLLARRWLSLTASQIVAAIVALNPFLIFFSGLILSETPFIAMLAWGMALLPHRRWFWGVLILAVSVTVRPSAIALPAILAAASVWANRGEGDSYHFSTVALRAAIAAGATALVLLPWAARNRVILDEWIWTTTNAGITAYDGFHPGATGASDQRFVADMPQLARLGEIGRSRYLSQQASAWAREHPIDVLRLAIVKIARTWSPIPLSAEYGHRHLYVIVGLLYSVPLDLLVIAGLVMSKSLSRPVKLMLVLPAVYLTVVHAMSVGSLRYRLPAEVPMAVVGACVFSPASHDDKVTR